jgi:hypothetical protein
MVDSQYSHDSGSRDLDPFREHEMTALLIFLESGKIDFLTVQMRLDCFDQIGYAPIFTSGKNGSTKIIVHDILLSRKGQFRHMPRCVVSVVFGIAFADPVVGPLFSVEILVTVTEFTVAFLPKDTHQYLSPEVANHALNLAHAQIPAHVPRSGFTVLIFLHLSLELLSPRLVEMARIDGPSIVVIFGLVADEYIPAFPIIGMRAPDGPIFVDVDTLEFQDLVLILAEVEAELVDVQIIVVHGNLRNTRDIPRIEP